MSEQHAFNPLPEAQVEPSINHATVARGGLRSLFRRRREARIDNQVVDDSSANLAEAPALTEPIAPEIQHGFEITGESAAFWEQGDVQQPTLFFDLVESIKSGEEERPRVLQASSQAVLSDSVERSKLHFTEAEGILDLDDYISVVKEAADKAGNEKMMAEMTAFQEKFSFLGTKEYEAATAGIAQAWLDYLKQSPEHILNVWTDFNERELVKSQTAVALDIMIKFAALHESSAYADQLKVEPEHWVDSPNAVLVVVDDYMASGTSVRKNIKHARDAAKANNLEELIGKTETHILIAKQDQRQTTDSEGKNIPIRSFFRAPDSSKTYDMNFSSAHSSTDYGFETVFQGTAEFLRDQGVVRELPLLAYIERSYYEDFATTANGQKALQTVVDARMQVVAVEQARQAQYGVWSRRVDEFADEYAELSSLNEVDQTNWRLEQRAKDDLEEQAMLEITESLSAAHTTLKESQSGYWKQESESYS